MALLREEFHSLEDLFIQQLEDMYDNEIRLAQSLPKMADAAHDPELKRAFKQHLHETEGHAKRVESLFQRLGKEPERTTCEGIKGIISEGEELAKAKGDDDVRDAALIAAAQRAEHYEIAGYGTLRTFARRLGLEDAAQTLQGILDEEKSADVELTRIAEAKVNVQATHTA